MVNVLRRFQKPLMIVITVLVIISFVWLYNNTQLDKMGADRIGTIYGRDITLSQAQRIGRKFDLCQDLGLIDLLRSLAVRQQDARENFIWNSLVLRHESAELGLEPTADEVVAAIQAMPPFQTNGQDDPARYGMITQVMLAPRGFTGEDLEDLVRDDLRLKKIKTLLGSTVAPTDAEVRAAYAQVNQKTDASIVRFKLADFLAAAQVTDEDAKKLYEERKASLLTEETRKVKYVAFILPTTDKPLEGKDRTEALGQLSKLADDFSVAMTEKDAKFEEVASKLGVEVQESPYFARRAAPPELGASDDAATAAFKVTTTQPNSDVVTTDRGYYVLQLADITAPRPLTFEEAKNRLVDDLKRERANETLNLKAAEVRNKIDAELKAGKSFADAATAAGVKAEKFPTFSLRERQFTEPNSMEVTQAAPELKVGQISPFVPGADGGVIVHVDGRPPIDEASFAKDKADTLEGLENFERTSLFQQWLKQRREAAQLVMRYQSA